MKSKSRQANDSSIHFDEVNTRAFFPGAFEIIGIIHALLESRTKLIEENQKAGITIPTNDERSILASSFGCKAVPHY